MTKNLSKSNLFGRDTDGEVGQCGREGKPVKGVLTKYHGNLVLNALEKLGYYGEHTQSFQLKSEDSGLFVCQFPTDPLS